MRAFPYPGSMLVSLLLGMQVAVAGGGLYGTLRQASSPRPVSGVELELACPGFGGPGQPSPSRPPQTSSARTDDQGAFTLRVPAVVKGRCELRVRGRGNAIEVFVSDSSLKYDLDMDNAGNLTER